MSILDDLRTADPSRDRPAPEEVRRAVADLLFSEADLLDDWRIEDWLRLFTDDCRYWVPSNDDDLDPRSETALIYDDHDGLEDRVLRLLMPSAHSQWPRSKVRRVIGNLRVAAVGDNEVRANSNFIVQEIRVGRERVYAGRYVHVLRSEGESWRIRLKKVCLAANDQPLHNLTFLL